MAFVTVLSPLWRVHWCSSTTT